MAIPTPTRPVDGDICDFSTLADMVNDYATWVNDLGIAEFDTTPVRTQHVVRPRIKARSFEGQRQILQQVEFALDAPPATFPQQWAGRQRISIPMAGLKRSESTNRWVSPLGFRVFLPEQADVTVWMQWEWFVRSFYPSAGFPGPLYPNSTSPVTGTAAEAGYFSLLTKRRFDVDGVPVSGDLNGQNETRVFVYPMNGNALDHESASAIATYHDGGGFIWSGQLAAGTWDLFLGYTGESSNPDGLIQVDVSAFSGTLEAYM